MLNDRKIVPFDISLDELCVSLVTLKRVLEYLREHLNAPIEWDREAGGF